MVKIGGGNGVFWWFWWWFWVSLAGKTRGKEKGGGWNEIRVESEGVGWRRREKSGFFGSCAVARRYPARSSRLWKLRAEHLKPRTLGRTEVPCSVEQALKTKGRTFKTPYTRSHEGFLLGRAALWKAKTEPLKFFCARSHATILLGGAGVWKDGPES